MKKKLVVVNIVIMLSVVFALAYQSLHAFSHHHIHNNYIEKTDLNSNISFTDVHQLENACVICDFKFAKFLSPNFFTYTLFPPKICKPYLIKVLEYLAYYNGVVSCLKGPPQVI